MQAALTITEKFFQVDPFGRVATIEIKVPVFTADSFDVGFKGHFFRCTRRVMHIEFCTIGRQRSRHGQNRCDADATGDQKIIFSIVIQREVVLRVRRFDDITFRQLVMNSGSAAPSLLFSKNDLTLLVSWAIFSILRLRSDTIWLLDIK